MSSLSGIHHPPEDLTDEEHDETIDPELRLRTVRTAASAIAESIKSEQRADRRRSVKKRSRFFRSRKPSKARIRQELEGAGVSHEVQGVRRNVYVNFPPSAMEVDQHGEVLIRYVRNKVRTTSELQCLLSLTPNSFLVEYTILTFIPKNLYEQFRRFVLPFF